MLFWTPFLSLFVIWELVVQQLHMCCPSKYNYSLCRIFLIHLFPSKFLMTRAFDLFILRFNFHCRYLILVILFWKLMKQVDLVPPSMKTLQFGRFLKNGKGICA